MTDAEVLTLVRPLLRINYHTIHCRENPDAVSGVEFFIEHPIIERLQGTLLECPVHVKIRDSSVLRQPGVYLARPGKNGDWEVRRR